MSEIQVKVKESEQRLAHVDTFPVDDGDHISWQISDDGSLTVYRWHPNCYTEFPLASYAAGSWSEVKQT